VNRESSMVKGFSESPSDRVIRAGLIPNPQSLLFKGLPEVFPVGRYHSWIINEKDFPEELEITARDDNGYIMALQHKRFDVQGVQFHPESVLTPDGEVIMRNWLKS